MSLRRASSVRVQKFDCVNKIIHCETLVLSLQKQSAIQT